MPMNFSYENTGELPTSADGIKTFAVFNNNGGSSFGGLLKGSFDGFSGKFGPTELPPSFTTPDGYEGNDTLLDAIQPSYSYEIKYQTYSRKVKKILITNYTQIQFDKDYGDAPDEFTDSPTSMYLPDGAFFSDSEVIYPLIQSWDGLLRYSPPKLNDLSYTKSSFGDYGNPHAEAKSTINFVGDA